MTARVQLIQIITSIDALAMCRSKLSVQASQAQGLANERQKRLSEDRRQAALELTLDCWKVLGLQLMAAGVMETGNPTHNARIETVSAFLRQGTPAEGEGT